MVLTTTHATIAAVFIAAAALLCAWAARSSRPAAAALALLAFAWFAVDNAWEGAVLFPVAHGHGLTVSDLPGVAAFVIGLWLLLRRRR